MLPGYFHRTPKVLTLLYPNLLWRMPSDEKTLYLTFDDGPVPDATPAVLDVLKSFGIKASFFCVGDNIKKHPDIFARLIAEGHAFGNHTHNHIKGWQTSTEDYLANIELAANYLSSDESEASPLFRPPYGQITRAQINALKDRFRIVMWDVLSGDFDQKLSKEDCLKASIKASRKGSIVVFHDSPKAMERLQFSLPRYIHHFLEKGYSFKAL